MLTGAGISDPSGNALAGTQTIDFFVLAADATRDRTVNFDDLVALAQNYNTPSAATFQHGDFNYDKKIDFNDLVILAQRYNISLPPAPAPVPTASSAPEENAVFSIVPVIAPPKAKAFLRPRLR